MRVLLVDDDSLVLKALKTILEKAGYTVVDAITNPTNTLQIYKEKEVELVVLDIRMKEFNGVDVAIDILKYDGAAKIMLLTTFNDEKDILRGLQVGVLGIILKDNISSLIPAIESVYLGNKIIDNSLNFNSLLVNKKSKKDFSNLNEKEVEIIEFVANGLSNKEIADKMFLSEGTVRNYISIILEKLNLRDRTQLAIYYYK